MYPAPAAFDYSLQPDNPLSRPSGWACYELHCPHRVKFFYHRVSLVLIEFAQTGINVSTESSSRYAVRDHVDIGHRIASPWVFCSSVVLAISLTAEH